MCGLWRVVWGVCPSSSKRTRILGRGSVLGARRVGGKREARRVGMAQETCIDRAGSSLLPPPEEALDAWPWVEPAPDAETYAVLVGFCFLLGFVAELLLALRPTPCAAEHQQPAPTLAAPVSLPPSHDGPPVSSADASARLAERRESDWRASERPNAPTCPLAAEFPAVHPGACTVLVRHVHAFTYTAREAVRRSAPGILPRLPRTQSSADASSWRH